MITPKEQQCIESVLTVAVNVGELKAENKQLKERVEYLEHMLETKLTGLINEKEKEKDIKL